MSGQAKTQFDYLLNAFEAASQHVNPPSQGYSEKRKALFAYVRGIEASAAKGEKLAGEVAAHQAAQVPEHIARGGAS